MNKQTIEYRGMSYEQCSREAERLLIPRDGWYRNIDKLNALHAQMEMQRNHQPRSLVWSDGVNSLWLEGELTDAVRDFLSKKAA